MQHGPLRNAYLDALGIDRWVSRATRRPRPRPAARRGRPARARASSPAVARAPRRSHRRRSSRGIDWGRCARRVAACTACELCKTRTQTVFGVGNTRADWLVIGEAPGAEEDRQGEPFVGRAGQLLNAMLLAIGLPRETGVHRQHPQVPAARQPRSEAGRGGALPAVPACGRSRCSSRRSSSRSAASPRRTCSPPTRRSARLRGQLHHFGEAEHAARRHLSSGLSAAHARRQAQGLGRPEIRARHVHAAARGSNLMAAAPEDLREVPEVHIRPMMEIDLPEVAAIEQASLRVSRGARTSSATACAWATPAARSISPGQIIGYGVMSLGAGEAHILNVCVRDEFRSRGLRPPAARAPARTRRRGRGGARRSSKCGPATWRPSGSTSVSASNKSASAAGITRPPTGAKTPSCSSASSGQTQPVDRS